MFEMEGVKSEIADAKEISLDYLSTQLTHSTSTSHNTSIRFG